MKIRKFLPKVAPLPANEASRLQELHQYQVLDTPPETAFDRITHMAAQRFGTPIALISLVDSDRQWFKSHHGLDATETPRDLAFCAHAILDNTVMVVHDALLDDRFAYNPLVTGAPDIRFYAGAPLIAPNGLKLGTMCVIDQKPHPEFNADDAAALSQLAAIVMGELELRRAITKAKDDLAKLKSAQLNLEMQSARNEALIREKHAFIASTRQKIYTPLHRITETISLLTSTTLDATQRSYANHLHAMVAAVLEHIETTLGLKEIDASEPLASNLLSASDHKGPPPAPLAVPLDMHRLEMVADTPEEKKEILQIFFRSADQNLATLSTRKRDHEFAEWKHAAHAMKGAASNLGMTHLAAHCLDAEKAIAASYDERSAILALIEGEIARIRYYAALHIHSA